MSKLKLGVIFGGMSTEHDVSISSGTSVIQYLDKDKYEIYPIYVGKDGKWYEYTKSATEIKRLEVGRTIEEKQEIENVVEYLNKIELFFPVLHGLYGEDGTIQGFLELLKKPYVGCKVLSSALSMDKAYTKIIFDRAGIEQAEYLYFKALKNSYIYVDKNFNEKKVSIEELCEIVEEQLSYPVFVKPSNSGSSVGISRAENEKELKEAIESAGKLDKKVLIEKEIKGREVECAVLGNDKVEASCVGEILPAEKFYTFDAKYKNANSRVVIPADLPDEVSEEIRKTAIKAFKAVDGSGLSRVDFFVEDKTGKVLINEINTMPGFTDISMYPKLWEEAGLSYTELLDKLLFLGTEEKNSFILFKE